MKSSNFVKLLRFVPAAVDIGLVNKSNYCAIIDTFCFVLTEMGIYRDNLLAIIFYRLSL